MGYTPGTFSANTIDPSKLTLGSAGTVRVDPLSLYQAQSPDQVTRDTVSAPMWTDSGIMQKYMDPYVQSVIDAQKQAAIRDFNEAKQARDAAAVTAGAYGGTRQSVVDSLANRDLQMQLAQIEAAGRQNAYLNAQQQFAADRAADMGAQQFNVGTGLQAALANQSADQATKLANLQAALSTQGLNTNAQLQAALANQSTAANQFNTLFGGQLQAALANQNAGLAAQQLAEQSRQFGANFANQSAQFADTQQLAARELNERLALAALGQQLQALGQAGQAGVNQADLSRLATQMQIQNLQQQLAMGQNEDARRQAALDLGYQDFLNQRNYPFQLANFYSGILRGIPVQFNQDSFQVSQANYNPLSQILGNAAGIAGLLGTR